MSGLAIAHRFKRDFILPSSREVQVKHIAIDLPLWTGERPQSDWNGKPIVGPPRRPFAELAILESYEVEGWEGAWVSSSKTFRTSWEPRGYIELPEYVSMLYQELQQKSQQRNGCWDILCWRDGQIKFTESKWTIPKDSIQKTQLVWLEAALDIGISLDNFVVYECTP